MCASTPRYLHGQVDGAADATSARSTSSGSISPTCPGPDEHLPGKGKEDWQSEKLIKLIRKLQPDIIIDDRLEIGRRH